MMQIETENPTVIDWWWDEQECRVPSKARMKRERQAWEEAESEELRNGQYYGGNYAGAGKDNL